MIQCPARASTDQPRRWTASKLSVSSASCMDERVARDVDGSQPSSGRSSPPGDTANRALAQEVQAVFVASFSSHASVSPITPPRSSRGPCSRLSETTDDTCPIASRHRRAPRRRSRALVEAPCRRRTPLQGFGGTRAVNRHDGTVRCREAASIPPARVGARLSR